jgi:hypothetical protein
MSPSPRRSSWNLLKFDQVFIGLFLEGSVGRWFGLATDKGVYEAIGSADAKVSFTSVDDVSRVLAVLAGMSEAKLEELPNRLHISGTSASMSAVGRLMSKAQSAPKRGVSVTTADEAEHREKTLRSGPRNPAPCLRFLMGNGSIDHRPQPEGGIGSGNGLVHAGESRSKWKPMEE